MNKRFLFRNMDHSNAMELYVNEHLAKVEEFLTHQRDPIHIDIVLEPSKVHAHHKVEIRVKTPDYDKFIDFEGPEMYKVIDRVIDTLYRELHEEKRRREDHLKDIGRHDAFKKQR